MANLCDREFFSPCVPGSGANNDQCDSDFAGHRKGHFVLSNHPLGQLVAIHNTAYSCLCPCVLFLALDRREAQHHDGVNFVYSASGGFSFVFRKIDNSHSIRPPRALGPGSLSNPCRNRTWMRLPAHSLKSSYAWAPVASAAEQFAELFTYVASFKFVLWRSEGS